MCISAIALHAYIQNIIDWNRKLHSVIQGITCKMVDNVADSDTRDMAEAMTETPQWLSKVQVYIYSHIQYTCTIIYK